MTLPDIQAARSAESFPHTSIRQEEASRPSGEGLSVAEPAAGSIASSADEQESLLQWKSALKSVGRGRGQKEKRETSIQRAILDRLSTLPYLKIERNNRGQKGHVRFGLGDGAADLVGLVKVRMWDSIGDWAQAVDVGRFFALEIKQPGEKPKPNQEKWAASVRELGGYVGCATSVEEALQCVKEARYGDD